LKEREPQRATARPDRLAAAGVLASAGLVASHCLGAVGFLIFGSAMGMLGAIHALEVYRPWFIAAGFSSWGYGFYHLYLRSEGIDGGISVGVCEPGGRARALLWLSLCVLLFAIALPTVAAYVAG
jgi:mercuric ion transport protein